MVLKAPHGRTGLNKDHQHIAARLRIGNEQRMSRKTSNDRHHEAQCPDPAGRFAYEGLDRVIHEKARLGILTSLATHPDGLLFPELKGLCTLTDGNLNRHLHVLSEAGLIEVWKRGDGKKSQTLARLTASGRRQFLEYLTVLETVVADALDAPTAAPGRQGMVREGWSPV
jgi:DNA-binding MarR family transcriptional regulator